MTTFARWLRFNAVGAMGMVVQLGLLALWNRAAPGHYLIGSALAVEAAVLHNFLWHTQYTWRDRHHKSNTAASLMRFHLSNGVVSIAGNLLLMRALVHGAHLPVLLANGIAIVCCSAVNFCLSHRWAFSASPA